MFEKAWEFRTAQFMVRLELNFDVDTNYDGDDENGETQADIDSGKLVMFDSRVTVSRNGYVIGSDYLGASCYRSNEVEHFWKDHRNSDPNNRNTRAMLEKRFVICHYFPDMVRLAIFVARKTMTV